MPLCSEVRAVVTPELPRDAVLHTNIIEFVGKVLAPQSVRKIFIFLHEYISRATLNS